MQLATSTTTPTPSVTTKQCSGAVRLVAGDKMKIELGTEEELDAVCPSGKTWLATVSVHVVETDA